MNVGFTVMCVCVCVVFSSSDTFYCRTLTLRVVTRRKLELVSNFGEGGTKAVKINFTYFLIFICLVSIDSET